MSKNVEEKDTRIESDTRTPVLIDVDDQIDDIFRMSSVPLQGEVIFLRGMVYMFDRRSWRIRDENTIDIALWLVKAGPDG